MIRRLNAARLTGLQEFIATLTDPSVRRPPRPSSTLLPRPEIAACRDDATPDDRPSACSPPLVTNEEDSRWWTLAAMCFALFLEMLDNTVVNVSLPSIQRDLHASLSALKWTVNAYTLTFAVLMVTGGRLGDIFGRRTLFLFGVVAFALLSLPSGSRPATPGWSASGPYRALGRRS